MALATVEEVLEQLKASPNDSELYQELGDLYFKRRDLMEAWNAYMHACGSTPTTCSPA